MSTHDLDRVVEGRHHDPHSILGPHPHDGGVTVRVLRPWATSITVVARTTSGEVRTELEHEHGGIFTGVLDVPEVPDYRLEVAYGGEPQTVDDPYRFLPTLGEVDLHLIAEGRHETLWTVLGAHERTYPSAMGDVSGTSFAVWAPSALGVRVVGDHNHWDGTGNPMRSLGSSGVWEVFLPTSPPALATSSPSSAATASGAPRPTRWPATPSTRRPRRRSSTRPTTSGATASG